MAAIRCSRPRLSAACGERLRRATRNMFRARVGKRRRSSMSLDRVAWARGRSLRIIPSSAFALTRLRPLRTFKDKGGSNGFRVFPLNLPGFRGAVLLCVGGLHRLHLGFLRCSLRRLASWRIHPFTASQNWSIGTARGLYSPVEISPAAQRPTGLRYIPRRR